jgi:hypothetical protein
MANTFGTDILIQAENPLMAADFYVKGLGFHRELSPPNTIPTGR